ncbi:hypothetical protein BDR26DRAFT_1006428 [Obelidium mucronatum]|nr:hypothetical protein BDR26DRAFT_1006428 [Obelidium mucronatum]
MNLDLVEIPALSEFHTSQLRRTVAIAVDESKYSEYAVKWAINNYLSPGDVVVLLNVRPVDTTSSTKTESLGRHLKSMEDVSLQISQELILHFIRLLANCKVAAKGISIAGRPKQSLVAQVNEMLPSVLILGSRGTFTLSRSLLGSVSDHCAAHSKVPVVIVKPTIEELEAFGIVDHGSVNRGDALKLANRVGLL